MSTTVDPRELLARTAAPDDAPTELLDVRSLGPPKPLKNTLETLPELDDDVVLIQRNDRAPQHLYPRLEERGYEFQTVERAEETVTVIWTAE